MQTVPFVIVAHFRIHVIVNVVQYTVSELYRVIPDTERHRLVQCKDIRCISVSRPPAAVNLKPHRRLLFAS